MSLGMMKLSMLIKNSHMQHSIVTSKKGAIVLSHACLEHAVICYIVYRG